MGTIKLDNREAQAFFDDAIRLAKRYCNDWKLPASWPSKNEPNAAQIGDDPGLALLKLFSFLIGYLADVENGIPFRWQAAFYRFLDASLRTALPAFAPIQFTLAGGQPATTVPAGSAVHDTASQTIRFETYDDLRVVPASIDTVLSMMPARDSYIDCQAVWGAGDAACLFPGAQSASADGSMDPTALAHWLLLGDPVLFKYDSCVTCIEVQLSGWHLTADYFKDWFDGALTPFDEPEWMSDHDRCYLSVCIDKPFADQQRKATIAKSVAQLNSKLVERAGGVADAPVDAMSSDAAVPAYWLLAKPADGVRVVPSSDTLPAVRKVNCVVSAAGALPQQTATNNALLDLGNGGYPFGKSPAREDAFYVRYDKAFAYEGSVISLNFQLADAAHSANGTIDWQFWDGAQNEWISLGAGSGGCRLQDGTNNLSKSGTVSFTCPNIGKRSVAGSEGYWIRAVLSAYSAPNGYGFEPLAAAINDIPLDTLSGDEKLRVIKYFATKNLSFVSRYQSNQATKGPFVKSLMIDYVITAAPNWTWRHNAFQLDRLSPKEGKAYPYVPLADIPPTVYVGFDREDGALHWGGEQVSLYFEIENERAGEGPALSWEWLDANAQPQQWRPLSVIDHTRRLARSASVRFVVPDGMQEAVCFSRRCCWLRVSGTPETKPIKVTGIYINTTGAFNLRTHTNIVLASSTGLPDQKYLLPFAGVHALRAGEKLQARNAGVQADIHLQVLEPPALDGNLSPESADKLSPVNWTCVSSFVGCGPHDRVFSVEGRSGTVTFGDGIRGMIPPAGTQNIIVTSYRTTDGDKGNIPAGSLRLFAQGIPGIAQVNNPVAARGGVDGESVSDLVNDAPRRIRANHEAITLDDFGALAEESSSRVCRAVAIPRTEPTGGACSAYPPRYVEIVVLAKSDEPQARTAPAVLDDVLSYVKARSPIQMQSRIKVKSPEFKLIHLHALLRTNAPPDKWKGLKAAISAELMTFLHPVRGGMANEGWPFGATVPSKAVSSFLSGLDGVVYVDHITVCGDPFQVTLSRDQLPTPGSIVLMLEAA